MIYHNYYYSCYDLYNCIYCDLIFTTTYPLRAACVPTLLIVIGNKLKEWAFSCFQITKPEIKILAIFCALWVFLCALD